jgi:hypothetical protein
MGRHVVSFATDLFLARPVKVELFQLIRLPAYRDVTSGTVIDHDGVPVINDMQRGRLVIKLDHCCPANALCEAGKLWTGNELRLYLACRDLNGWRGEFWAAWTAHNGS